MKLTVGFIPSAYEPRYVVGEVVSQGEAHSARVAIREPGKKQVDWAIPVGTFSTSDPEQDDA